MDNGLIAHEIRKLLSQEKGIVPKELHEDGCITVDTGEILKGSGTIDGTVVNRGGIISPGNSPGILVVGALDLGSFGDPEYTPETGVLLMEIGGRTAGPGGPGAAKWPPGP